MCLLLETPQLVSLTAGVPGQDNMTCKHDPHYDEDIACGDADWFSFEDSAAGDAFIRVSPHLGFMEVAVLVGHELVSLFSFGAEC